MYAANLRQGSYPALASPNTERTSIHFAARLAASESIANYTRGPVWPGEPTEKKRNSTQRFMYGQHIDTSVRCPSCQTVTLISKGMHLWPTILTFETSTRLLASLRTGARQTGSSSRQETTKGTGSHHETKRSHASSKLHVGSYCGVVKGSLRQLKFFECL